jgi:hypothetical protein
MQALHRPHKEIAVGNGRRGIAGFTKRILREQFKLLRRGPEQRGL